MQSTYAKALAFVLQWEGGFSDVPGDAGGPTNYGITWRDYDAFRQAQGLPHKPVQQITMPEVQTIYQMQYWDRIGGDKLPYPLDFALFDTAVNCGVGYAQGLYQIVKAMPPVKGASWALHLRALRYRAIAVRPSQQKFLQGWLNRVDALRAACL